MCGIAGVVEFGREQSPSAEALARMATVLAHRGPDEQGVHRSGAVGLIHRRLSIIDITTGQQPMYSPDGQVCVVFNGEIYNYPDLKAELEQHGYQFRTQSDTEVLLALYLQYGLDAFAKINGMLACAFWDATASRLVLVRDRFGKKPLFYHQNSQRFLFGSEMKALLAYGGFEKSLSLPALHEYLTFGYTVGTESVLSGIQRLPPAHLLILQHGRVRCQPYWTLRFQPTKSIPPEAEVVERVEVLLTQAVKRRLMSEVPLGAFLSGGIDSSTVVALMARLLDQPVKTFAIGFDEAGYSELADARLVAQHLQTDHVELIVKPSALEILPHVVKQLDEPFGDSSAIPTYYVCQAARQYVTVALSGDGGDEVFAGYRRYQEIGRYQRMGHIPDWVRRQVLRPLVGVLPFTWPGWNALYAMGKGTMDGIPCGLGLFPYIQEQLYTPSFTRALAGYDSFALTERILADGRQLDPVSRYQYLDTLQYLPDDILVKVDRMSMANSLEVRSPFLDYTLVEYMATLPVSFKLWNGVSKRILRKVCSPLLPPAVLLKRKQGFAIPQDQWFRRDLRAAATEILLDRSTLARGYFRRDTLERMLQHHATGQRDYSTWMWCLLVFELWCRQFLDTTWDTVPDNVAACAAL